MIRSPATVTLLLRWLSTKHNSIDLAKKAFPASESKNTSKKDKDGVQALITKELSTTVVKNKERGP